jgi:hypothetical protein
MEASLDVGAGTIPEGIGQHHEAHGDEGRTQGAQTQDVNDAGSLDMVVDASTPTPLTPNPTFKKQRNAKPKRVELELLPGEDVSVTRSPVDDHAGRRNKLGVCYHKPSDKWRAIVYMQKKQVNLGYFATKEESERHVHLARTYGVPKQFVNLRALRQPKRSGYPGVNWDKHCLKWLARVYLPSEEGKKGKEIKVGYFDDEKRAWDACKRTRVQMGLPETAKRELKKKESERLDVDGEEPFRVAGAPDDETRTPDARADEEGHRSPTREGEYGVDDTA